MVRAIVGANWGDEGKGKITDMLGQESDIIVRTSFITIRCFLQAHYKYYR